MQACYCAKLSLYTCSLVDTTRPTAAAFTRVPELCKMPLPHSVQLEALINRFDTDAVIYSIYHARLDIHTRESLD